MPGESVVSANLSWKDTYVCDIQRGKCRASGGTVRSAGKGGRGRCGETRVRISVKFCKRRAKETSSVHRRAKGEKFAHDLPVPVYGNAGSRFPNNNSSSPSNSFLLVISTDDRSAKLEHRYTRSKLSRYSSVWSIVMINCTAVTLIDMINRYYYYYVTSICINVNNLSNWLFYT